MADNRNWRNDYDRDWNGNYNRRNQSNYNDDDVSGPHHGRSWNYDEGYDRETPHTDVSGRTGDDMNKHRSFSGDYNYSSGSRNNRDEWDRYDTGRYGNENNSGSRYGNGYSESRYENSGNDRGYNNDYGTGDYRNNYNTGRSENQYNSGNSDSDYGWGGRNSGLTDQNYNRSSYAYGTGNYGRYEDYPNAGMTANNDRWGSRDDQYRGKGPKGYQRSEDRIRDDIYDRLTDDDHIDASNIEVQVQGNKVTLSGYVDDKRQKRRAEDLVEDVSGVNDVENNIKVNKTGMTGSGY